MKELRIKDEKLTKEMYAVENRILIMQIKRDMDEQTAHIIKRIDKLEQKEKEKQEYVCNDARR